MPQLKNLCCSIQWSESGAPFQEYGTHYGDGVVETFIIVPNRPQSFTIRLRSRGFIYDGLAAVVFADGNYQTNRNRINLIPSKKDQSLSKTEVDFLIRQKEKPLGDGMYMGREWRFDDHNIVSELPEGVKENHFDNIGIIEVLVLRCRTRFSEEAPASPASSGADSDIFCERTPHIGPDAAIEITTPIQEDEEVGGFIGLFDGTDDRGNMFGLDGSMPPSGNGWHGYPQHRFPSYPPNGNNDRQFNPYHDTPDYQPQPDPYLMPHSGPTAPRPERRVCFDFGPHGPPPSLHDARVDPVESRPPSYDRYRYPISPSQEQNPAPRYPPQWFPTRSPCRYPLAPCHCGSPYHRTDENTNMNNDFLRQSWSVPPNLSQYEPPHQGYATAHHLGSNYRYAAAPSGHVYPFIGQQHRPHAMASYTDPSLNLHWPSILPIPYHVSMHPALPNQQPYSVPPTNNGANTGPERGNQQQQSANTQDSNAQSGSNVEGNNSNNGPSNNQGNNFNDQSQSQEQSQNAENTGENNTDQAWVNDSNDNNAQGNQSNETGNENSSWGPNDIANNDSNNVAEAGWKNNDGNNNASNGGDIDWGATKTDDHSNSNNNGDNNNQHNDSNDQFQNNTNNANNHSEQNTQGVSNPQTPPRSISSNVRPLFGPYGQYYTWEPKRVDAPSPDAEEEPRYDVPKSIADRIGTSKQVQPGQGYLYCKKRSVPEYIDDMKEPYARFVFKYRTKEQVKNELGIEIETEPTGDESIQEFQNLDKQDLIDMLVRAKSALGGKVPSPPPKPVTSGDEISSDHRLPVPVEPPNHQFLKYQMPPVRRHASVGTQSGTEGVNASNNNDSNTGYNSKNNDNSQQWTNDWTAGGNQQNQVGSWDGAEENKPNAQTGIANNQRGNQNQKSQVQSRVQSNEKPEYIPIPLPGPPPPQPTQWSNSGPNTSGNTGGNAPQPQTDEIPDPFRVQNVSSAASSPASVRPPFNPTNAVIENWDPPQQAGKSKAKKPLEPQW